LAVHRVNDPKLMQAKEQIRRWRGEFPKFAEQNLKVLDKGGNLVPFTLNAPQMYLHNRVEQQRREKGFVRVLVLKGRQQGISTYVEGRFYWRTSLWPNVHAYILSHEQKSAEGIFAMAERYHLHNPVAPTTGKSNVKELSFERLKSKYTVATAGSKASGRGTTITIFHGSEVGFWKNDTDHFKASVQAVPLLPGTEIFLESTANGPEGQFYEKWQDAVRGIGDYIAVFIPWFWTPEYRREPPPGFELDATPVDGDYSDAEYAEMFGLDMGQMYWRRMKMQELGGPGAFKQEYPATPDEAFQSAEKAALISALSILKARKRKLEPSGPLILGVDPGGDGIEAGVKNGDRFCVAFRRGHKIEKVLVRQKLTEPEALDWIISLIDTYDPAIVFIDSGGPGRYIIGFLRAKGPRYGDRVRAVNFGSKSQHKNARPLVAGPVNRRAEMWERLKRWLDSEEGVEIPDQDDLHADLLSALIKPTLTNDLQLVSKQEMRSKGQRSPDMGDACALTFADLVYIGDWKKPPPKPSFDMIDRAPPMEVHSQTTLSQGGTAAPNGWMGR